MQLTFSVKEASEAIGIGHTKIYEVINSGCLPAKKLGKRTIILKEDIEKYLSNLSDYPT